MDHQTRLKFQTAIFHVLRKAIFSRNSAIFLTGLWVTFSLIGPTGQTRFPLVDRFLMNFGWVVLIVGVVLTTTPSVMYFLAIRGRPIAWSISITTMMGVFIAVLVSALTIYLPERVWIASFETFFGVGGVLAFVTPILFLQKRHQFLLLCDDVLSTSPGWYLNNSAQENGILRKLPSSKRGTLLMMKAQGNYTEITTTAGVHLLHGSLKALSEMTLEGEGIRFHRSIWVRWDQIDSVFYRGGNPYLKLINANEYPVSRSAVASVKHYCSHIHLDN